jgi:ribosomal protein S18 acetylase RimI-like enzyme
LADWSTRAATGADIDAVLELWRTSGGAPSPTDNRAALAELLRADPDALLIADMRGETIGTLIAAFDGWRGNFYRLAVRADRRREGIARTLVMEGERRLRAGGARRLSTLVDADDPVASAFWRAAGYRAQGDRARFVREA